MDLGVSGKPRSLLDLPYEIRQLIYTGLLSYSVDVYNYQPHPYSIKEDSLAPLLRLASTSHQLRSEIGGVLCNVFATRPVHFKTNGIEVAQRVRWASLADRIPSSVGSVIRHVIINDQLEIRRTPSTATASASRQVESCCWNLFECRQRCIHCKKFPSMRKFQVLKEHIGDWQIRWDPSMRCISERCLREMGAVLPPDEGINDNKAEISMPGLGRKRIFALLCAYDRELQTYSWDTWKA